MYSIETQNLVKDYQRGFWNKTSHRALDNLSLQVESGIIFGLLGPNGAGKSTTLKILMRLIYPTAGSARLLGQAVEDISIHEKIGYLPEAPYFYDYLTAREFLDYCGRLFGLPGGERRRRVGRLLDRVGMAEAADRALRTFSRGMLQRIGIAQSLINNPELVFLDEPMLGLDPVGRHQVRQLLLELRQEGKTICFSTHILADAESLCDQVAILNQGKLHGVGALGEILGLQTVAQEILVAGLTQKEMMDISAKEGVTLEQTGEKLTVKVLPQDLYEVVEQIRRRNGRVLAVQPVRPSLEDYFFEAFGTEKQLDRNL